MDEAERKKRILKAVQAVEQEGLKYWQASKRFGVPKSTVHDHVSGHSVKFAKGRFCIFSQREEKKFVELFKQWRRDGYRLTPNNCRKAAYLYAEFCGYNHRFNQVEKMAGRKWFDGFAKRNGLIVVRRAAKKDTVDVIVEVEE